MTIRFCCTLIKQTAYPFGQLPVMEIDGMQVAQSVGLLRYCGLLTGLYPKDMFQGALVDQVVLAIEDIMTATVPSIHESDQEKRVGKQSHSRT